MKVTLHQLRVFHAVATHGSVTKAANHLHMTQPAVSNIIKQLETIYDCDLIEVISRQLSLTHFGEILLSGCHQFETVLNDIQTEIDLLKGGLSGTLCVATVSTAKYFLPAFLGEFKNEFKDINIKLTVCNRQEVIERLERNLDDFVIMSHVPRMLPVDVADFYDDELVLAAARSLNIKHVKGAPIKALKDYSWIIRESGSGTRFATENLFKKHQFSPRIQMEIGDIEAIKQAIIANMGISIISKHSVKLEIDNKLIKLLPIKGLPVKHKWFLVKNKGKKISPIAQKFYEFVRGASLDIRGGASK